MIGRTKVKNDIHTWCLWTSPSTPTSPFIRYGPQWRYVMIYTEERTTPNELTNEVTDFACLHVVITIEKYVVDGFEIGSQKARSLLKWNNLSVTWTQVNNNQLTPSTPLNLIVGPYWLTQPSWNTGIVKLKSLYEPLDWLIPEVLWGFRIGNSGSGVQEHSVPEKSLRHIWK